MCSGEHGRPHSIFGGVVPSLYSLYRVPRPVPEILRDLVGNRFPDPVPTGSHIPDFLFLSGGTGSRAATGSRSPRAYRRGWDQVVDKDDKRGLLR